MRSVLHLLALCMVAMLLSVPAFAQAEAHRTTKCLQCQPLVVEYNKATDEVARLQGQLDALNEAKAELEKQKPALQENVRRSKARVDVAKQNLDVDIANGLKEWQLQTARDKVALQERQFGEAEQALKRLSDEIDGLQPQLAAAIDALAAATAAQGAAANALDGCEKLCAARGGISTITPDGLVVTWCAACKELETALNRTIRERRRIDGLIVLAEAELAAARAEFASVQDAKAAAMQAATEASAETNRVREVRPKDEKAIRDADRRSSEAYAKLESFDEPLSSAAEKRDAALREYDRLTDRRDRVLPQLEVAQRAALEECENRLCGPPQPTVGGVGLPVTPVTVTTDCPACQSLATALQETLRAIAAKGAELDAVKREIEQKQTDLATAEQSAQATLEAAIAEREIARDRLRDQYNALVRLAQDQRTELEDCEKECKKVPPKRQLPDLRTSLLQQEDECRRDQRCLLVATLKSDGDDYYGPLFLSVDARLMPADDGQLDGLTCIDAARGSTLCYGDTVSLQDGATLELALQVVAEPQICVAREMPHAGDPATIGAWIQFGLAQRGFSPGPIDGKIGPKTYAAIGTFLRSAEETASGGRAPEELLALLGQINPANRDSVQIAVFELLFGPQPGPAGQSEGRECSKLRLARAEIPVDTKPKARVTDEMEGDEDTILFDRGPDIDLEFEIRGGGEPSEDEETEGFEDEAFPGLLLNNPGGLDFRF